MAWYARLALDSTLGSAGPFLGGRAVSIALHCGAAAMINHARPLMSSVEPPVYQLTSTPPPPVAQGLLPCGAELHQLPPHAYRGNRLCGGGQGRQGRALGECARTGILTVAGMLCSR